jgi:hypothetical protein
LDDRAARRSPAGHGRALRGPCRGRNGEMGSSPGQTWPHTLSNRSRMGLTFTRRRYWLIDCQLSAQTGLAQTLPDRRFRNRSVCGGRPESLFAPILRCARMRDVAIRLIRATRATLPQFRRGSAGTQVVKGASGTRRDSEGQLTDQPSSHRALPVGSRHRSITDRATAARPRTG